MLEHTIEVVALIIAIIGLLSKTTEEVEGRLLHRPTRTGWVLLSLLLLSAAGKIIVDLRAHKVSLAQEEERKLVTEATLRLILLNQEFPEPVCSLLLDFKAFPASEGKDAAVLLFGEAWSNRTTDLDGILRVYCYGKDWTINGAFIKGKPCFSSGSRLCKAGFAIGPRGKEVIENISVMDRWSHAIRPAPWAAFHQPGSVAAELGFTFDPPNPQAIAKLRQRWKSMFKSARLILEVDSAAGLWLVAPLEPEFSADTQGSRLKLRWKVVAEPTLAIAKKDGA